MDDFRKRLGTTIYADIKNANLNCIQSSDYIQKVLYEASYKANVEVINAVKHDFEPQGCTVILLLAESHVSIHAWPEYQSYSIDIYTCGDADPNIIFDDIINKLKGEVYDKNQIERVIE